MCEGSGIFRDSIVQHAIEVAKNICYIMPQHSFCPNVRIRCCNRLFESILIIVSNKRGIGIVEGTHPDEFRNGDVSSLPVSVNERPALLENV